MSAVVLRTVVPRAIVRGRFVVAFFGFNVPLCARREVAASVGLPLEWNGGLHWLGRLRFRGILRRLFRVQLVLNVVLWQVGVVRLVPLVASVSTPLAARDTVRFVVAAAIAGPAGGLLVSHDSSSVKLRERARTGSVAGTSERKPSWANRSVLSGFVKSGKTIRRERGSSHLTPHPGCGFEHPGCLGQSMAENVTPRDDGRGLIRHPGCSEPQPGCCQRRLGSCATSAATTRGGSSSLPGAGGARSSSDSRDRSRAYAPAAGGASRSVPSGPSTPE